MRKMCIRDSIYCRDLLAVFIRKGCITQDGILSVCCDHFYLLEDIIPVFIFYINAFFAVLFYDRLIAYEDVYKRQL